MLVKIQNGEIDFPIGEIVFGQTKTFQVSL